MRKTILFLVLIVTLPMAAKEYISLDGGHDLRGFGEERYSLSLMAEYGYNQTWGHMGNVDIFAHMPVVKNVQMDARMQYQSANVFTGAVVLRPTIDLPVGQLFAETEVMYKGVFRNRMHDFNAALSVGWRFDYVSVQIGGFMRVMDSWDRSWHSEDKYEVEPFNLLYRLEVFARPQKNNWNISVTQSRTSLYEKLLRTRNCRIGRGLPHWRRNPHLAFHPRDGRSLCREKLCVRTERDGRQPRNDRRQCENTEQCLCL